MAPEKNMTIKMFPAIIVLTAVSKFPDAEFSESFSSFSINFDPLTRVKNPEAYLEF